MSSRDPELGLETLRRDDVALALHAQSARNRKGSVIAMLDDPCDPLQAEHADAVVPASCTCLCRVAKAPAITRQSPADLHFCVFACVLQRRRGPAALVPDQKAGTTDHATVVLADDCPRPNPSA